MTRVTDIQWTDSGEYTDIIYSTTQDGIAKITINRPEVHNAFRPQTLLTWLTPISDLDGVCF
jgi:naphthoate synthase